MMLLPVRCRFIDPTLGGFAQAVQDLIDEGGGGLELRDMRLAFDVEGGQRGHHIHVHANRVASVARWPQRVLFAPRRFLVAYGYPPLSYFLSVSYGD